MTRELSGELAYRIKYDVEHDLFHAQNVFNGEYIKPTFIEYVQELEKENIELKSVAEFQQSSNMKRHFEIQKLEKESKELKSELIKKTDTNHSLIEQMAKLEEENTEQKDQLTKAKEIIKNLLILKNDHYGNTKMEWRVEVTEQAEQFLKEETK